MAKVGDKLRSKYRPNEPGWNFFGPDRYTGESIWIYTGGGDTTPAPSPGGGVTISGEEGEGEGTTGVTAPSAPGTIDPQFLDITEPTYSDPWSIIMMQDLMAQRDFSQAQAGTMMEQILAEESPMMQRALDYADLFGGRADVGYQATQQMIDDFVSRTGTRETELTSLADLIPSAAQEATIGRILDPYKRQIEDERAESESKWKAISAAHGMMGSTPSAKQWTKLQEKYDDMYNQEFSKYLYQYPRDVFAAKRGVFGDIAGQEQYGIGAQAGLTGQAMGAGQFGMQLGGDIWERGKGREMEAFELAQRMGLDWDKTMMDTLLRQQGIGVDVYGRDIQKYLGQIGEQGAWDRLLQQQQMQKYQADTTRYGMDLQDQWNRFELENRDYWRNLELQYGRDYAEQA